MAIITVDLDEDADRAIEVLTSDGTPVSVAIHTSLVCAAAKRIRTALRNEAGALKGDRDDVAEAARVLRDGAVLRAH